jgi:NADPH:quinone reductase-like Zn-dependent oxidoreductase
MTTAELCQKKLRELAALVNEQQLPAALSTVFELAALAAAFQAQRGRRPPGKVIISVLRARPGPVTRTGPAW